MHFPLRPPPPPRQPAPPSNAPMLVQATEIRYDYTKITRLPRSATCRSITAARLSKPIRSHTVKNEATARGGQRPAHRARRQDHVWPSHRSDRRLSRRICRFAATRNARRDSFCRRATVRKAITTSYRMASIPPANPARTIRESRRYGRSRPPASSTMRARRCFISKNASVEFFGVPLAYVPFMSTPDPTVKRKSGFLFPGLSQTSQYGFGAEHKVNLTSLTRQQAEFDASVFWRRQIRAMPATGVVYRYPFISVSSWGTHHRTDTQIVLRPNETDIAPSSIVSSLDI